MNADSAGTFSEPMARFPYVRAAPIEGGPLKRLRRLVGQILNKPESEERREEVQAIHAHLQVEPDGVGISLSGGGIRAASFGLGALQGLGRHGLLYGPKKAKYLTAVSGGSYIATAFAMISKDYFSSRRLLPEYEPFAHGSPEEQHLRDHTQYLTHGRFGVAAVIWRLFIGIVFNLSMFIVGLSFLGMPLGYLYRRIWPSLQAGCPTNCPSHARFAISGGLVRGVLTAVAIALVLGIAWLVRTYKREWTRNLMGLASGFFLVGAGVVALLFIGFPTVIHLARPVIIRTVPGTARDTKVATSVVGLAGLFGVVLAWITTARRVLTSQSPVTSGVVGRLRTFVAKHKILLVNIVATIAGPILVLVILFYLTYWASAYSPFSNGVGHAIFWSWLVALGLFVALWLRADVTAWSLFPFYRRRLSASFILERDPANQDGPPSASRVQGVDASERDYATPYLLSAFQSDQIPEVIICAAANVSGYGATPTGSNVTSFTFSSEQIGGPLVQAVPTAAYEQALMPRAAWRFWRRWKFWKITPSEPQARFVTFPSVMAISGAAFSPSMGKMTRGPFRLFIALLNLRLGVWVPNPRYLDHFKNRSAHPLLPRPQYFVRELLGINHINAPFLYVTDGGHYDNLGLVELLRRRCKQIWCIDASGDQIDSFDTLGGALRQAESELQVHVDIHPFRDMAPSTTKPGPDGVRYVKAPYCKGVIHYSGSSDDTTGEFIGTLYYVKLGVPNNAPWSIKSFAAANPSFPCDPTLDQLFDADRFEAYRELGAFAVEEAMTKIWE
ncbi:MAG TPA: hypothetical protein VMU68_05590 [Acidimicrobiales bacterium]|nr:hypothetical protein [Acidimicrobiales bacterium]